MATPKDSRLHYYQQWNDCRTLNKFSTMTYDDWEKSYFQGQQEVDTLWKFCGLFCGLEIEWQKFFTQNVCGDKLDLLKWAQTHEFCQKPDTGKTDPVKTDPVKTEPSYLEEEDLVALYELIENTPYKKYTYQITDTKKWTPELGQAILDLLEEYKKRTESKDGATWNSVFGSEG